MLFCKLHIIFVYNFILYKLIHITLHTNICYSVNYIYSFSITIYNIYQVFIEFRNILDLIESLLLAYIILQHHIVFLIKTYYFINLYL